MEEKKETVLTSVEQLKEFLAKMDDKTVVSITVEFVNDSREGDEEDA